VAGAETGSTGTTEAGWRVQANPKPSKTALKD
jgi:hypothetical protein